ncbi:MAG: DUF454 family protein [Gammaproteobacteria bacterium]|nr:DUF454 family protein [Gammaproteobacteria bacterium]
MLKSIVMSVMTLALLLLGLIGLVVPVIPGVLFLFASALCAASVSPGARARLYRSTHIRRAHQRWSASAGMAWFDRVKLAFWLGAEAMADMIPGARRRR